MASGSHYATGPFSTLDQWSNGPRVFDENTDPAAGLSAAEGSKTRYTRVQINRKYIHELEY